MESRPGAEAPEAIELFAQIARAITRFEPVLVLARPEFAGHAAETCGPEVEVVEVDFFDVWLRDSGPLLAIRDEHELVAVEFRFNNWGSKKVPRDRYSRTGRLLAERLGIDRIGVPYVVEGGAISADGQGALIALEPSILNENRNPGASRQDLERAFADYLGVDGTIWLPHGLIEDGTGGHADNVAVFVGPGRVLCQSVADPSDPNAPLLAANRATLEAAGLEVLDLPVLPYLRHKDRRLAQPYLNFFVGNGFVVVPVAGAATDEQALDVIGSAFPGREVIGVPGETLARAGGGVHCVTQHEPLLPALSSD
jgi:agmatine deiminase